MNFIRLNRKIQTLERQDRSLYLFLPTKCNQLRCEKTFPDLIGHSNISEENLLGIWENDPRLKQLIKIDEDMRYERE